MTSPVHSFYFLFSLCFFFGYTIKYHIFMVAAIFDFNTATQFSKITFLMSSSSHSSNWKNLLLLQEIKTFSRKSYCKFLGIYFSTVHLTKCQVFLYLLPITIVWKSLFCVCVHLSVMLGISWIIETGVSDNWLKNCWEWAQKHRELNQNTKDRNQIWTTRENKLRQITTKHRLWQIWR